MTTFYVIGTGQTTFEVQSRVESAAGVPLTGRGVEQVRDVLERLAGKRIHAIYSSSGESERQAAHIARKILGAKARTAPNLREIDYGLWQGLTVDEIRRRQPSAFKQWKAAPATIRPPGGESIDEAQQRILKAVKGILRRHKDESPLLVLRPVALGLLRCALENKSADRIWQQAEDNHTWYSYETNAGSS